MGRREHTSVVHSSVSTTSHSGISRTKCLAIPLHPQTFAAAVTAITSTYQADVSIVSGYRSRIVVSGDL